MIGVRDSENIIKDTSTDEGQISAKKVRCIMNCIGNNIIAVTYSYGGE